MNTKQNDLLENIDMIHTTELGLQRICKNLNICNKNTVEWCKKIIAASSSKITLKGKNWYISVNDIVFTVNKHSYTIITAHKSKSTNILGKE